MNDAEGSAARTEEQLVERLLAIQTSADGAAAAAEKQRWYAQAYRYLTESGHHWWCRHGDVTAGRGAERREKSCPFPSSLHSLACPPKKRNTHTVLGSPALLPSPGCNFLISSCPNCGLLVQAWPRCCATMQSSPWCRPSGDSWRPSWRSAPTA